MENLKTPKVFISYSWTSEEHKEWVLNLAERLRNDGVDVVLDRWDLKDGYDVYKFMEENVKSEEIDNVLIICDKGYKEKADNRTGGAGIEAQIITPELYNNVKQEKFIPIVAERDENGNPYLPVFLESRKYIDLSNSDNYETGYEKLLRAIFKKPELSKPPLGTPPSYLFEDSKPPTFKTYYIVKQIKDSIDKNPRKIPILVDDFFVEFIRTLNNFKIDDSYDVNMIDDIVYKHIDDLKPLRDHYISLLETLCLYYQKGLDLNPIVSFFEEIYSFVDDTMNTDHYKFLIRELFLYTIAILIKYNHFEGIKHLTESYYFVEHKYHGVRHDYFQIFDKYVASLDKIRNQRLNLRKISYAAQLTIDRAHTNYPRDILVETDLLLYYLDCFNYKDETFYCWYPRLYVYLHEERLKFFPRLKSRRYFDNAKLIFSVNTVEEMRAKISNFKHKTNGYPNSFVTIPHIASLINPDSLCSLP